MHIVIKCLTWFGENMGRWQNITSPWTPYRDVGDTHEVSNSLEQQFVVNKTVQDVKHWPSLEVKQIKIWQKKPVFLLTLLQPVSRPLPAHCTPFLLLTFPLRHPPHTSSSSPSSSSFLMVPHFSHAGSMDRGTHEEDRSVRYPLHLTRVFVRRVFGPHCVFVCTSHRAHSSYTDVNLTVGKKRYVQMCDLKRKRNWGRNIRSFVIAHKCALALNCPFLLPFLYKLSHKPVERF